MNQKGYDSLRLPSIDLTMHDLQFSMNQSAKNSLSSLLTESVRQVMRDDMPRKISQPRQTGARSTPPTIHNFSVVEA
jgi:hypothetical protein